MVKMFLNEFGYNQDRYIVYYDSNSVIYLSNNASFHSKSKNIDVRYHCVRDVLESKSLELIKIHTDKN